MESRSKAESSIRILVITAAAIIGAAVVYTAVTASLPVPKEVMHIP